VTTRMIGSTMFTHDPEYQGNVTLIRESKEIVIPFQDIKQFVAEYVAQRRKSLQSVSPDIVLGLPPHT